MVDASIQTEYIDFSSPSPLPAMGAELVRTATLRRLALAVRLMLRLQGRLSRRRTRRGRLGAAPATVAGARPVIHVRRSVLIETSEPPETEGDGIALLAREATSEVHGTRGDTVSPAPEAEATAPAPVIGTAQPAETPKAPETQDNLTTPRTPEPPANNSHGLPYVSSHRSDEIVLVAGELTPMPRTGTTGATGAPPPTESVSPSHTAEPSPSVDPAPVEPHQIPAGWFLDPRRAPPPRLGAVASSHPHLGAGQTARPWSVGWDGRLEELVTRSHPSGGVAGLDAGPGPEHPGPGPTASGLSNTGDDGILTPETWMTLPTRPPICLAGRTTRRSQTSAILCETGAGPLRHDAAVNAHH